MSANIEICRNSSSLLAVLPWLTGAIKTYDKFSRSFLVPNGLEVIFFSEDKVAIYVQPPNPQGLLLNVDAQDKILFSSQASTKRGDFNIQQLMGIEVNIQGGIDVVGSRPHGLEGGQLSSPLASRLFTVLCGYRLADVMSLLSGAYPTATIIERSPPPMGILPVCASFCVHKSTIAFTASHSIMTL